MKNNNVSIVGAAKKYNPHKKLPPGETKSEILLYIAENSVVGTDAIRDHLRSHLNIKNKKITYDHLSKLEKWGYIVRITTARKIPEHGKKLEHSGTLDYFSLATGFTTLQHIFNYLKDHQKEKDLIGTKYFKSYVSTEDFRARAFIYFVKEAILALINYAKSDEVYNAFIKKIKENRIGGYEESLNILRNADISKAKYTNFSDWNKVEALSKAKNPKKTQILSSMMAIMKNTDPDTIFSSLNAVNKNSASLINYVNFLVPEREMPEILAMIRSSSTAVDYVLNFKLDPLIEQFDFMRLMGIFIRFQLWKIADDPIKAQNMLKYGNDSKKILDALKDFSNVESKSPIYTLVSLAFVHDFLHQNTDIGEADRETINQVLSDMFLPRIKATK
jgi:hypothetical protein